jgi:hypothetical protein
LGRIVGHGTQWSAQYGVAVGPHGRVGVEVGDGDSFQVSRGVGDCDSLGVGVGGTGVGVNVAQEQQEPNPLGAHVSPGPQTGFSWHSPHVSA